MDNNKDQLHKDKANKRVEDKKQGSSSSNVPQTPTMSRGRILLELAKKQASQKANNTKNVKDRSKTVEAEKDLKIQNIQTKPSSSSTSTEIIRDKDRRKKGASTTNKSDSLEQKEKDVSAAKVGVDDDVDKPRATTIEATTIIRSKTIGVQNIEKVDGTERMDKINVKTPIRMRTTSKRKKTPCHAASIETSSDDDDTVLPLFHGIGPTTPPPATTTTTTTTLPSEGLEGEKEDDDAKVEDKKEFDWEGAVDSFDTELYEMLQEFFESAFTILAYKLGLQPKDQFEVEHHEEFGQVPVFCHEESQQYVEEISKSAVVFIRKGVLDGAVFHVNMLNKDNCPITQQRFVFRPRGMFCADKFDVSDATRVLKTTQMCKTQLLEMLKSISDLPLEELKCPWYSQWSISLGLKQEFIQFLRENGHDDPFRDDPAADFFPWKKRPRLSQAVKLGLVNLLPKTANGTTVPGVISRILESRKAAAAAEKSDRFANLIASSREKTTQSQLDSSSSSTPQPPPKASLSKLPEWEYFTSSSESEDDDIEPQRRSTKAITRPKQKLFLKPISSQEVLPQLMILVYRIEYTNSQVPVDDAMIQAAKDDQRAHEEFLKFSD